MNELDTLVQQAQALFAQCASAAELENAKAQFLGKSGRISEMMKGLSQLDLDAKKTQGAVINLAKQSIVQALDAVFNAPVAKMLACEVFQRNLLDGDKLGILATSVGWIRRLVGCFDVI